MITTTFCAIFFIFTIFYTKESNISFKTAAVASTNEVNSQICLDIFNKGGSAADAAIATLLCGGLCSPQSMGIGGGFLLTYYEKKSGKSYFLNARERAPEHSSPNMFQNVKDPFCGGLAVGVPGEVRGYWELHKKFGKLPWKDLFQSTIKMCREGFRVSPQSAKTMVKFKSDIKKSPTLSSVFINSETQEVFKPGETMTMPKLAETLEWIAIDGPDALYNGRLTDKFLKDINNNGGIMTRNDLASYTAKWMDPLSLDLPNSNFKVVSSPLPGSGSVLFLILDTLFGLGACPTLKDKWFCMVEAWKHAFGFRSDLDASESNTCILNQYDPKLGLRTRQVIQFDEKTSQDVAHYTTKFDGLAQDGGTCHISVLAPNGDAVAITSSINHVYGSCVISQSTGILLNNQMMDFNLLADANKQYKFNLISPGKQPMSSMVPTIITDTTNGKVKMVVGGAGGFKILTATSQTIIDHLLYDTPIDEAMVKKRLHHQLAPMVLFYEEDFPDNMIDELKNFGHVTQPMRTNSGVAVICVKEDDIFAFGDPRRNGSAMRM